MSGREEVVLAVTRALGRPARWASPALSIGSYDGCERTLEIFNADGSEQLGLLRRLRGLRAELERATGGPIVFVFHTRGETARLYANVPGTRPESGYRELANALGRWITEDHRDQPAVDPDEVERFSFGERAA